MFLDPRIPAVAGTVALGALLWTVYEAAPLPADLSSVHREFLGTPTRDRCSLCHREDGVNAGCLDCHAEIGGQLSSGSGFHAFLQRQGTFRCGDCHQEHFGTSFPLVSSLSWGDGREEDFDHPHVDFALEGAHDPLDCKGCHTDDPADPFHLPDFPDHPRGHTFLGLEQGCVSCHEDPHAGGLATSCDACHAQDLFDPPVFDHAENFPLVGGHDELECRDCHLIPSPRSTVLPHPFPFDQVQGSSCEECHGSPHRTQFAEDCDACHAVHEEVWTLAAARMTDDRHARTGFRLDVPHQEVACSQCHAPELPYDGRHPDPEAPGYLRNPATCQGCHEDVHGGQFAGRFDRCLDCHDPRFFHPTTFTHADHAQFFALSGAHEAIDCTRCHLVETPGAPRRFAGTATTCKGCHQDAHAGQFAEQILAGDCSSCHRSEADTFEIRPYDHLANTGYALRGAHARADCAACHVPADYRVDGLVLSARRFVGTPTECASCHKDVHRGQFATYPSCADCHTSNTTWQKVRFDHNTQSRFPLEGAHLGVACSQCHRPVVLEDKTVVVQYKPLGRECRDCHDIDPKTHQAWDR